jgi:hypothetical protein
MANIATNFLNLDLFMNRHSSSPKPHNSNMILDLGLSLHPNLTITAKQLRYFPIETLMSCASALFISQLIYVSQMMTD